MPLRIIVIAMENSEAAKPFPHSFDQITVDWLNSVLRDGGVITDDALESVEIQSTKAGFGARGSYTRLRLNYSRQKPGVPQSLFAKFSLGDQEMRARYAQMYKSEVNFYREIAPLVGLRTPRCYFAGMDVDSGHSLLLLEDLAGRAGDNLVGCSTGEAEKLFGRIAAFHARWWESVQLSRWKWLPSYGEDYPAWMSYRLLKAWPIFRRKYDEMLSGWVVSAAERALRQIPEIFQTFAAGPTTFTHGDFALDNVRFDLPDAPLVLYDWQLVRRAPGARDISWFLVRSLPISQRRADEDYLVRSYYEALVEAGIHDYSLENLHHHIMLGYLVAFLIIISAGANADFSSKRGRQHITARIERNIAVLKDHDVWQALTLE